MTIADDPLCTLTILKRDASTKEPLRGAEFLVKYSDGTVIGPNNGRYTTGSDGTVTVSGLKPDATVVVSEQKAPTGYLKDDEAQTIVVRSGVANSLTFDDEPTTTLVIHKYISGTDYEPLAGVGFKVTDGNGGDVGPDAGTYYTDKSGEIVLSGLEPGMTVTVREIHGIRICAGRHPAADFDPERHRAEFDLLEPAARLFDRAEAGQCEQGAAGRGHF